MIKITNDETYGWKEAIRGMRNPMNSWDKSDSYEGCDRIYGSLTRCDHCYTADDKGCLTKNACRNASYKRYIVGSNDLELMKKLTKAGTDHRKFMRMITVYCDITAPLYWWKEFDTYKAGTVTNSCSTMHKIQDKEFVIDDFSHEHLIEETLEELKEWGIGVGWEDASHAIWPKDILEMMIDSLNNCREAYLKTKDKKYWWQMIQLLPSSYNQKRTVMMNYEVLANIYKSRKNHKLDEWHVFCDWIEMLPYSELITGEE